VQNRLLIYKTLTVGEALTKNSPCSDTQMM